ncbi:MAG: hypothetical protein ACI39Q_03835 [Wujia sp.]
MNPMALMKIKGMLDRFRNNHPKIPMFLGAAAQAIDEGSIIEVNVTTSGGKTLCTNMKVTADDMEMVRQLSQMKMN